MPDRSIPIRRLFGIPFATSERAAYGAALLKREGNDARASLDEHDKYLEIIATRASPLCACYSIFLTVTVVIVPHIQSVISKLILITAALILLACVLLLYPCLWIFWQKSAKNYEDVQIELNDTIDLLFFRSTLYNCSMALSCFALFLTVSAVFLDLLFGSKIP